MKNSNVKIPEAFYRVSAKALITDKQERFLLIKEDSKYWDGWDIPGGGIDFGENPKESVKREVEEEMGLTVLSVAENPSYFITAYLETTKTWIANVFYKVEVENLEFTPTEECTEIKFFSTEEVLSDTTGKMRENIVAFAKQYKA